MSAKWKQGPKTAWPKGRVEVRFGPASGGLEVRASSRIARVLIVDAQETSLRLCSTLCDLFHFDIACARNGPDAIEALSHACFDVVLMDLHVPGLDGLQALRVIRGLPSPSAGVPIIAVTNDPDAAHARACLASGMADLVPRPITAARLFKAVTSVLEFPGPEQAGWSGVRAG